MVQVLIIDDDPIIRMVLKRTLQDSGYDVLIAQTGEEGLAQARVNQPALIICDWQMPPIDGLEVCRQIKSDRTLFTTFFILLTSRTAISDRIKGLDSGADEFLSKPIDISELKARVRAGLRMHQLAKELQTLAADLHIQKQALEAEFAEAAEHIRLLLPKPMTGPVAIDFRFLPSRQLGGDCFDYYWLDPDYLMIYLLDVSGHGLGSALPSVAVQNLLRSQSLPDVNFYQPQHVLTALNDTFQMREHNGRYFTIWYGVYNRRKRQLIYASAGHPPAVLVSEATSEGPQVKCLKTRGAPIGMLPEAKYVNAFCDVAASSTLYIFSDGIYETKRSKGSAWNLNDFVNLLVAQNATNSHELDHILQQAQAASGRDVFEDDCSLLQIKLS